jgi:hypothetical protein
MPGDTLCTVALGLLTLYVLVALFGRGALQRIREDVIFINTFKVSIIDGKKLATEEHKLPQIINPN